MWLEDKSVIERIENGELDFRTFLTDENLRKRELPSHHAMKFDKPEYLDEKLEKI